MNLTIGIISCNRLNYLRTLINSLKSLKSDNTHFIEIIVVDNGSKEDGLINYLNTEKENGFIDNLILNKDRDWCNDEYKAKNLIIKESQYNVILFLQDDLNFIGTLNYLVKAYDAFLNSEALCMDICGVRNSTIFRKIDYKKQYEFDGFKYWGTKNNHFQTIGLFKKEVFQKCGQYPVGKKYSAWKWKDNPSIQQENYYSEKVKYHYKNLDNITILSHVPLIITIWNDPRGGYAFVRENKRYGHYIEPTGDNDTYYKKLEDLDIEKLMDFKFPSGFINVAKPLGWNYRKDTKGEQEKCDKNKIILEGPFINI